MLSLLEGCGSNSMQPLHDCLPFWDINCILVVQHEQRGMLRASWCRQGCMDGCWKDVWRGAGGVQGGVQGGVLLYLDWLAMT